MGRRWYSKAHDRLVCPPPDTAEQIAWRLRSNAALKQAHAEANEKFAPFTAGKLGEALAYQENRYKQIMGE